MPWPNYPMIMKTTSSHEEGCERFWGINTKAFLADENGNLRAILITDVSWEEDSAGRLVKFVEKQDSEREISCQLVLLAMGFMHPQHEGLVHNSGVELDERGNVNAREGDYLTNVAKVFAAGDVRRGQSLVVWAISEGREAARKVDEFLMGQSSLATKDRVASIQMR